MVFALVSFRQKFFVNHFWPDVDPNKIFTLAACDGKTGESKEISYSSSKAVGNGSFGVVFQAKLLDSGEYVAIKKVLQDKRFKVCRCFLWIDSEQNL